VYGEGSAEVQMLRSIRDQVLSKTSEGREVIDLYYEWSPKITRAMEEDCALAEWIKLLLQGLTEYTMEISLDTNSLPDNYYRSRNSF
jgi:hypothetical protein